MARINRPDGASAGKITDGVRRDPPSEPGEAYEHFTLKEIDEQPRAAADAMRDRVSFDTYDVAFEHLRDFRRSPRRNRAHRVAGYWDELARSDDRPVLDRVAGANPLRDRQLLPSSGTADPLIDRRTLVISVSQSGETADTLAAMETARAEMRRPTDHMQRRGRSGYNDRRLVHLDAGRIRGRSGCQQNLYLLPDSTLSSGHPSRCPARDAGPGLLRERVDT